MGYCDFWLLFLPAFFLVKEMSPLKLVPSIGGENGMLFIGPLQLQQWVVVSSGQDADIDHVQ